jgi:hypothetical protein
VMPPPPWMSCGLVWFKGAFAAGRLVIGQAAESLTNMQEESIPEEDVQAEQVPPTPAEPLDTGEAVDSGEVPVPDGPGADVETPPGEAPPPRLSRFERRGVAVTNALRTLVRDLYTIQFRRPEGTAKKFKVQLEIDVDPEDNWALHFEPDLLIQVKRQLEDAEAEWGSYIAGRVYDFHADSAKTNQSVPPSATMVFSGYDNFGTPQWCEFSQVLLDRKDPRVDKLFEARAPALNVVQFGKELKSEQLSSYGKGSKTYSLLGQIAFGYLFVPGAKRRIKAGSEKLALTFQVVETRDLQGAFDLRINTIAGVYSEEEIQELLLSDRNMWIYRARELAQRGLDLVKERAVHAKLAHDPSAYNAAMKKVPGVIREFSKSLERGGRQSTRRTHHAEHRRQKDQRPVHKALEDVLSGSLPKMFRDRDRDSNVVIGSGQRAHVFSDEGCHITSFSVTGDELDQRVRKGRWEVMSDEAAQALRDKIQSYIPPKRKAAGEKPGKAPPRD